MRLTTWGDVRDLRPVPAAPRRTPRGPPRRPQADRLPRTWTRACASPAPCRLCQPSAPPRSGGPRGPDGRCGRNALQELDDARVDLLRSLDEHEVAHTLDEFG